MAAMYLLYNSTYFAEAFSNKTTFGTTTLSNNQYECLYEQAECDVSNDKFDPYRCCGCYETDSGDICFNIDRKNQLTAFFLQLFLPGLSVGCWYLGQYGFAAPMLSLSMLSCCCKLAKSSDENKESGGVIFAGCFGCILAVLQLSTLIMIGMNQLANVSGNIECVATPWSC